MLTSVSIVGKAIYVALCSTLDHATFCDTDQNLLITQSSLQICLHCKDPQNLYDSQHDRHANILDDTNRYPSAAGANAQGTNVNQMRFTFKI